MRNILLITLHFLFLLPFFSIIKAQVATEAKEENVALSFPLKACDSLEGDITEESTDGFTSHFLVLKNKHVTIKMPFIEGWGQAASTRDESFAIYHKQYGNSLRLSFRLYERDSFFNTLELKYLKAYARLLKKQNPQLEILNEKQHFFVENTFFIFGKSYRMIKGSFKFREKNFYLNEYIVVPENDHYSLIIIRYEGEENIFKENLKDVINSLRFSLIL